MAIISRFGFALVFLGALVPFAAATNCKSNEFWYEKKSCCLPHGGPPSPPPPPPPGKSCPPTGYWWRHESGCCVPHNPPAPNPPAPTCGSGWLWDHSSQCCNPHTPPPPPPPPPPPKPSGHRTKRDLKSRALTLCPKGLDACPIAGLTGGDYECIDTTVELESCGGCVSLGHGQDCTAIKGAWNVGCERGSCAVYTCSAGYKRAADGQSCIAL